MLNDLRNFYKQHKIAAEAFDCSYALKCKARCEDFVAAREAFVGSEYEKGTLPRLLFVSLDAASDHPGREPEKRTISFMRYWEENGQPYPKGCVVDDLHGGSHWYRTHEFAYDLLRPIAVARGLSGFRRDNVHKFFAHTDSAKCKDAARGTKKGHSELFANCRGFVPGEVAVLRPRVLVAQGVEAHAAVEGAFPIVQSVCHPELPQYRYVVATIAGELAVVLTIVHPSARSRFHKERNDAYSWYLESTKTFLMSA